jgi:uncharacterized membrane protein
MEGEQVQKPTKSSGLQANIAGALAYFLGPITGILFLLIEKQNKFVRFHAMQSTLTFGGIFILNIVLGFIPLLGWLAGTLLSLLWLFLMYKAFNNEEYELPVVGEIARKQIEKM